VTEMTRHRVIQLAATALCVCAAASVARAHHSHGIFYDACKPTTIEGRIDSIQWKDPHTLLDIKRDDGSIFHAEWMSLREVTTRAKTGPAQQALTFGTRVVIMGYLLRPDADIRASFAEYKGDTRGPNLVDVMQIRRADNSWSWQAENLPTCKSR
jgi:hypothetical protein